MRILIIDDEESMRHMLSVILKKEGYDTVAIDGAAKALDILDADDFDFVLSDIKMPGMSGLDFLKALAAKKMERLVIMMSAYGTIDTAVECMKLGAYDYISKPFKVDEIILILRKAEERERLKRENMRLSKEAGAGGDLSAVRTADGRMREILDLIKKVADYDTPVLLTGESGTGKELAARALHYGGARGKGPFVVVNCGAIPANLLESELFGHVKGAFTDAHRNKTGLFQEADGGTLFLDEIGELPLELQVKLLRALQESEVRRVGDVKSVKIDTRVVAATVRDLRGEIKTGGFREDLFYRLNVIEIKLPPLRERTADILALAEFFIERYAGKFAKKRKTLTEDAVSALMNYSWPGNVRELENVIERAMILVDGPVIDASSLPIFSKGALAAVTGLSGVVSIKKAHEIVERELIKKALDSTGNNRTRAAEVLEISHRALLYKIKDYEL